MTDQMQGFDCMMWRAHTNAHRHRMEVRRKTARIEQADRFVEMSAKGIGDAVREYTNAYVGFDFCGTVIAAYE